MESEENVRNILDKLLKNPKTLEEFISIKFLIDDYIEDGYKVQDYFQRYNRAFEKFKSEK